MNVSLNHNNRQRRERETILTHINTVAQEGLLVLKKQIPVPLPKIKALRSIINAVRQQDGDINTCQIYQELSDILGRHIQCPNDFIEPLGYNIAYFLSIGGSRYLKNLGSTIYDNSHLQYGICNRLDDETSGATIIALDEPTFRTIRAPTTNINKVYIALLNGILEQRTVFDIRLSENIMGYFRSTNERRRYHEKIPGNGHVLIALPLKHIGTKTLCLVRLFNGLHHQIRATMSSVGYPLVSDNIYTELYDPSLALLNENLTVSDRLFLHALYYVIDIDKDTKYSIYCPLSNDLQEVLMRLDDDIDIADYDERSLIKYLAGPLKL